MYFYQRATSAFEKKKCESENRNHIHTKPKTRCVFFNTVKKHFHSMDQKMAWVWNVVPLSAHTERGWGVDLFSNFVDRRYKDHSSCDWQLWRPVAVSKEAQSPSHESAFPIWPLLTTVYQEQTSDVTETTSIYHTVYDL